MIYKLQKKLGLIQGRRKNIETSASQNLEQERNSQNELSSVGASPIIKNNRNSVLKPLNLRRFSKKPNQKMKSGNVFNLGKLCLKLKLFNTKPLQLLPLNPIKT